MIYLSRMKLDPKCRSTMKALAAPNLLHGAIEQAFSGPRERNLWRVDSLQGNTYLLLLSRNAPDLTRAYEQFGPRNTEAAWETRNYEPLLARVTPGSRCQFRLVANPTISKGGGENVRGKVHGHITADYQKKWLLNQAEKHGFLLHEDEFGVVQSQWLRFYKGADGARQRVTLLAVTYEGALTITDADLFRQVLTEGLGRGKAYGMGMLTIAGLQRHG